MLISANFEGNKNLINPSVKIINVARLGLVYGLCLEYFFFSFSETLIVFFFLHELMIMLSNLK